MCIILSKQIRAHPFFAGLRWDRLQQKRITPPYLPINDEVHVADPSRKTEVDEKGEDSNGLSIMLVYIVVLPYILRVHGQK